MNSHFRSGSKHIDPDTGLIYFKYDFGYEFGIILPGEGKRIVHKKKDSKGRNGDIDIPVQHFYSDDEGVPRKRETPRKQRPLSENFDKSEMSEAENDYSRFKGKVIPHFIPKKKVQFQPIKGEPFSDSEREVKKDIFGKNRSPMKGFVPVLPKSRHGGKRGRSTVV